MPEQKPRRPEAAWNAHNRYTFQELKHLSPEAFVILAIEKLREHGYNGIHTKLSGFNGLFREVFPDLGYNGPVKITRAMAEMGLIVIRPARSGVVLYKCGEDPDEQQHHRVDSARRKMAS